LSRKSQKLFEFELNLMCHCVVSYNNHGFALDWFHFDWLMVAWLVGFDSFCDTWVVFPCFPVCFTCIIWVDGKVDLDASFHVA